MTFQIKADFVQGLSSLNDFHLWLESADKARNTLISGKGAGSDYLGWLNLPFEVQQGNLLDEIDRVKEKVHSDSSIFIVVGIGGSYLGAKASLEALKNPISELEILKGKLTGSVVRFAGHHLDSRDLEDLLQMLDFYDFSVNVISKSGTTTEPALAFRILRDMLKKRYGAKYAERVFATTDIQKGALRQLSDQESYTSFVIPDNVGGRYSIFTAVGLLPLAVAGIDVRSMIQGAVDAQQALADLNGEENPAMLYAALRNYFLNKGKGIEILVSYLARTSHIGEWWKQLFGESEGKDGKGIWPSSAQFTTDLHSLGQWIQDGPRNIFETILDWEEKEGLEIPADEDNLDGLNYLSGQTLSYVNEKAREGTMQAHMDGGVPLIRLQPGPLDAYHLGALYYFFEYSCGISAYMLGVNPFDQPGVEAYKKNMFSLLGKP